MSDVGTRNKSRSTLAGVVRMLALLTAAAIIALVVISVFVPKVYGGSTYTVASGSMAPTINTGDLISTTSSGLNAVSKGDVITYVVKDNLEPSGEKLIVHRIVGQMEHKGIKYYLTKGDANELVDPPVPSTNVTGKVMYSVPLVGYFSQMKYRSEIASSIFVVLICVVLYTMYKSAIERSKRKLEERQNQ